VKRSTSLPERLRASGATDTGRRWLDAAAGEEPSPELRERMARGVGLSMAAVAGHEASTKPSPAPPAASPAMAMATRTLVGWISAGVATIAVVGGVVAIRGHEAARSRDAAPSVVRPPSTAIVSPPLPSVEPTIAQGLTQPRASPVIVPPPAAPSSSARLRNRSQSPADDLAGQVALIDAARSALSSGMADRALDALGQYQSRYPAGSFRPEATALRIEALVATGRNAEARALAERFVSEHPGSPLADRVAREVGASPR